MTDAWCVSLPIVTWAAISAQRRAMTNDKMMHPSDGLRKAGRPSKAGVAMLDEALLDVADALFRQNGYEATSVAAIAAGAGASKRTVYHRYASKAILFEAVLDRAIARMLDAIAGEIVGNSTRDRLENMALRLIEMFLGAESLEIMRIVIAEANRFSGLARSLDTGARFRIGSFVLDSGELAPIIRDDSLRARIVAEQFVALTLTPVVLRALLGVDPARLKAETPAMISENVALFLRGSAPPALA